MNVLAFQILQNTVAKKIVINFALALLRNRYIHKDEEVNITNRATPHPDQNIFYIRKELKQFIW